MHTSLSCFRFVSRRFDALNFYHSVVLLLIEDKGFAGLGEGEDKGYMELAEGLGVKTWSVSHGHCIERHSHQGSSAGLGLEVSPRLGPTSFSHASPSSARLSPGYPSKGSDMARSNSNEQHYCVYDSSAYFIRDIATGKEVLIFGDIEPDSVSFSPRNKRVWSEAAPKIVAGQLGAVFIECSYDDSRSDDTLFGHLTPRYVMEELQVLGAQVQAYQRQSDTRKRKQPGDHTAPRRRSTRTSVGNSPTPISPMSKPTQRTSFDFQVTQADGTMEEMTEGVGERDSEASTSATPTQTLAVRDKASLPLKGVKVVIIHMKEKLDDGPAIEDLVLQELLEHEDESPLGCEFIIARNGEVLYF